jgi:hypothetical protein
MVISIQPTVIKYHGTPFSGTNGETAEALIGRHAFVSFAAQSQLDICLQVCQSVALDNGAFSAWKSGKVVDWQDYFRWAQKVMRHPCIDWAIIPDVIDGDEEANVKLIAKWHEWFHTDAMSFGVPVWHMHESDTKLKYLAHAYKRIAIGSSAEFAQVGTNKWHERMTWAMKLICDENGQPKTKVHMLRGLDPSVFTMYPFSSADSTNAGRNCGMDGAWNGTYAPKTTGWRARVIMASVESFNSSDRLIEREFTRDLFSHE